MIGKIFLAAVVIFGIASAQAQQQMTQSTPWHVSTIYSFTDEQLGSQIANGIVIASVPTGYSAVIEHISARCAAPPTLAILFAEVVPSGNPSNPGQSGTPGAPPLQDTAHHPFLFQSTYSGTSNVYIASQAITLRVNARPGDPDIADTIRFFGDYLNTGSEAATITCLFSISGYLQKP